jgi:membrane-associated PAP2 superfamily phosphatase
MRTPHLSTWWRAMRWPTLVFVLLATLFATTDADLAIAKFLFFDAGHGGWIGAHNWWVETFLHTGGRRAIRVVVVAAIAVWAASFHSSRLASMRRPVGYFAAASVLGIGIVGLLKTLTNVDCPWDLIPFGGHFPVVPLFSDRPDALRAGQCFPAAHASSGYALIALYFAVRERSRAMSRWGLALGIACGLAFGLAQQSRGAHFLSHDLWSAFLVWTIAVSVYVFGFEARLSALPPRDGPIRDDLGRGERRTRREFCESSR